MKQIYLILYTLSLISISHIYCSNSNNSLESKSNSNLNIKENLVLKTTNKNLLNSSSQAQNKLQNKISSKNKEKSQGHSFFTSHSHSKANLKANSKINLNEKFVTQIKANSVSNNSNNHKTIKNKIKNKAKNKAKNKSSKPKSLNDMFNSLKSKGKKGKKKHGKKNKKKLPKKKVLWEGWLKFIAITDKKSPMQPNKFFVNPEFKYQKVFKRHMKKKDKKGYLNIKDRFQFYGLMKHDGLYIFKSRKTAFDKSVEEIKVIDIKKINEKKKYMSSIREIEDFQKNFCLKIKTKYPFHPDLNFNQKKKGHSKDFIICLEKRLKRNKLISILIELKFSQQKKEKKMKKKKPAKKLSQMKKKMKKKVFDKPKNWVPKDGYWILLQDWTQCSLKCGGGTSYQQWMCVPPKKNGRKCQGKAIRTKPCNVQPCPGNLGLKNEYTKSGKTKTLKPIIKSMPFSLRPQNYLKCIIKEFDVFYMADNPNKKEAQKLAALNPKNKTKKIKRPGRLVMNTNTISLFNDDNFKNAVFSFNLKNTEIAPKKTNKCCFELQSNKMSFTICGGFGQPCKITKSLSFTDQWVKDFTLFKQGCYQNLKIKLWKKTMEKKALKNAMDAAGLGGLNDRANLIKKKVHQKQMDQWNKKIQNTENTAMKAMKREFDIEKMLQAELQLKAELESKKLLNLKKREKKKKECLQKALKNRDEINKNLLEKLRKQQELNAIKANAKKEVQAQRSKLREKLNAIRNKFKRRKRLIEQDINVIRAEMAKNIMDANRKGNMLKCKNAYGNKEKIKTYCNKNIVEDYMKNVECRSEASFCYVCCETEFGNMVMEKRGICYKMCDKLMKSATDGGDFIWV